MQRRFKFTVRVMEYDNTEYMNLGTVMVANATRDLVHDSSHTEDTKHALVEFQVPKTMGTHE